MQIRSHDQIQYGRQVCVLLYAATVQILHKFSLIWYLCGYFPHKWNCHIEIWSQMWFHLNEANIYGILRNRAYFGITKLIEYNTAYNTWTKNAITPVLVKIIWWSFFCSLPFFKRNLLQIKINTINYNFTMQLWPKHCNTAF